MLLSTPAESLIPKDSFSSLLHLFQVTLILALFPCVLEEAKGQLGFLQHICTNTMLSGKVRPF